MSFKDIQSMIKNVSQVISDVERKYQSRDERLIEFITEKHGIDYEELVETFSNFNNCSDDVPSSSDDKKSVKKSSLKHTTDEKKVCPYVFSKGANVGDLCGKNVSDGTFCYKHKSQETKVSSGSVSAKAPVAKSQSSQSKTTSVFPKSLLVATTKETSKTKSSTVTSKDREPPKFVKKVEPATTLETDKASSRVMKVHPSTGRFWDPPTGFVYNNSNDQQVIGKFKAGKIIDLDEEDIQKCKEKSLKLESKYESRESSGSSLIEAPKSKKTNLQSATVVKSKPEKEMSTTNLIKGQITNILFKKTTVAESSVGDEEDDEDIVDIEEPEEDQDLKKDDDVEDEDLDDDLEDPDDDPETILDGDVSD